MMAVFTTALRGLTGVAASALLVAIVWAAYIHRDSLSAAGNAVTDLLPTATQSHDPAPAAPPAPAATPGTAK